MNYKFILLLSLLTSIALPLTATASSFTTANIIVAKGGTTTVTSNLVVGSASYNSFYFTLGGSSTGATALATLAYNAYTPTNVIERGIVTATHQTNDSSVGNSLTDKLSWTYTVSGNAVENDIMVGLASTFGPANVIGFNSIGGPTSNDVFLNITVPSAGDQAYILGAGSLKFNNVLPTLPAGCTLDNIGYTAGSSFAWAANCVFATAGFFIANVQATSGTAHQTIVIAAWVFNTPTAVLGTLTANNPYFGNNIHTSLQPQVNSNASATAGAITYQWYSNTASNVGCTTTNAIAGATSANYIFSITKTTWFAYNAIDASTNQGSVCSNSIQAVDPTIASFPTLPATMIVGQSNISVSATWTAYSGMGSTSGTSQVINFLAYNSFSGAVVTNTLLTISNTALSANIVLVVNTLWKGNTIAFNAIIGNTLNPSQVFTGNIQVLTVLGSASSFACSAPVQSTAMVNGEPYQVLDPSNMITFSIWGSNGVALELMASLGAQPYLFNSTNPTQGIGYVITPVPNTYFVAAIYNSTQVPAVVHQVCQYFVSGIGVLGEPTVHGLVSASGVNSIAATTTAPNTLALGNSLIATTLTGANGIITTQTGTNAWTIGNSLITVSITTTNSIFASQTGTLAWTIGNTLISCPILTQTNSIFATQTGCNAYTIGNTLIAVTITGANSLFTSQTGTLAWTVGNNLITTSITTYNSLWSNQIGTNAWQLGNYLIPTGSGGITSCSAANSVTVTVAGGVCTIGNTLISTSITVYNSLWGNQIGTNAWQLGNNLITTSLSFANSIQGTQLGTNQWQIGNTVTSCSSLTAQNSIQITQTGCYSFLIGNTPEAFYLTLNGVNSIVVTPIVGGFNVGNTPISSGGSNYFAGNGLILTGSTFSVNALAPLTSTAAGLGLSTTSNFSIHNGQLDFKAFSCVFLVCSLNGLFGNVVAVGAGNAMVSTSAQNVIITVTGSGGGGNGVSGGIGTPPRLPT